MGTTRTIVFRLYLLSVFKLKFGIAFERPYLYRLENGNFFSARKKLRTESTFERKIENGRRRKCFEFAKNVCNCMQIKSRFYSTRVGTSTTEYPIEMVYFKLYSLQVVIGTLYVIAQAHKSVADRASMFLHLRQKIQVYFFSPINLSFFVRPLCIFIFVHFRCTTVNSEISFRRVKSMRISITATTTATAKC